MKRKLGLLSLVAAMALTFNSVSAADFNVAIVDVPQLVSSSAQVQALKKEQQAKAEEMIKFIESARKDVANISDAAKKKARQSKHFLQSHTRRSYPHQDASRAGR